MRKLLKAYKTEINPSPEQKVKIHQTIGNCRFLYNAYIAKNKELYEQYQNGEIEKEQAFMSGMDFDKYVNNELSTELDWVKKAGSKARKKAIMNAENAFRRFFKGQSQFPRFKKKSDQDVKMYFPKNNKGDWTVERHRIKIPTLSWVKLKEFGYIPTKVKIKSGTVSQKAGRYFVSVIVEYEKDYTFEEFTKGIGIDLGLKDFAIVSNVKKPFKNINKTSKIRKLEKKLRREQRRLSRKYESLKTKNKKEGTATRQNIRKQIAKVQRIHQRLSNIRTNYINQVVNEIVKTKPSHITIEDLNVRGLMKNKHLSKAIQQQKFYEFRIKLEYKCRLHGIELRVADRFFPSSKLCSSCGQIKKDLKLKDRVYRCDCGLEIDRDKNASLNLCNAKLYKIAN